MQARETARIGHQDPAKISHVKFFPAGMAVHATPNRVVHHRAATCLLYATLKNIASFYGAVNDVNHQRTANTARVCCGLIGVAGEECRGLSHAPEWSLAC
jgi:hypothetical protein